MNPASKKKGLLAWLLTLLIVSGVLGENRAWGFFAQPGTAPGQIAAASPSAIGENYDASAYDAPDCAVAPGTGEKLKTVTSWADEGITPDLNPGRWVQLGEATKTNFWKTGLPGPKAWLEKKFPFLRMEKSKVPFTNSITDDIPASQLQWPSGWEKWKGIFGQRQIKGGG